MKKNSVRQRIFALSLASIFVTAAPAAPATYDYVDWTSDILSSSITAGSASGTLTAGSTTVAVTYSGDLTTATQVGPGGIDYYVPASVYTNSQVANVPTNNTLLALSESPARTDTLTFSSPLLNPILDIVSLGAPGDTVTYSFDATPVILSQGAAYWGGCATCLSVTGNSLSGTEGSGVIEFLGSYSGLSWTTTGGEYWNGFTVGVQGLGTGTTVPEPATWTVIAAALTLVASGTWLRRRRAE